MLDSIMLNVLFLVTPIVCYLIYVVYENVLGKEINDIFFNLAILTSVYLIIKYSIYFNDNIDMLKVILIICLLKNKKILSILISLSIIVYFNILNECNMLLMFLQYFIQISLYFVLLKKLNVKYRLTIFVLIDLLFQIYFKSINTIPLFIINICYVLLALLLTELLNRGEKVINLYGTVRQIEDEKKFRDSLFKVTHEIKNPIAVCKGYLDMLDVNNEKQINKYVPIIKQEIERTLTLMNDFLNLNKLKVEKTIIDISLLLDDLCSSVDSLLLDRNIEFTFNIKDEDIYINGDYDRLKQVFLNIIKNSMEAILDNKIGLINLTMEKINNKVVIKIKDNGVGMDSETLKNIGEPFFTTKKNGTGLGIKLCNEIIELHKGKIKYSSKKNEGTIVEIELPIKK